MHYRNASVAALALILSACSTPQHTNLLIFGTNTVVGLKVGADATSTPAIQVGYARQELVLMPLLANTAATNTNGDLFLHPCPAEKATPPGNPPTLAELSINCKFVGAGKDAQDSYSVLASFGAKFDAKKVGQDVEAGGAIAQYFATGLAARELAKHGSSLVAASESATADAKASNPAALAWIRSRNSKFSSIASLLENSANVDDGSLLIAMGKLDAAAGTGQIFQDLCQKPATKAQCVQRIRDHESADIFSLTDKQLDDAQKVVF